uniref:THO complex subunit 4-like n=1 Tax=Dermatophagoides pteronyssinus TaxID=6956 RepID=A0A6P6Y0C0_DERPT|nr:THO complex subunit 4-like [Dermatophagoides pteronyssinus]
MSERIDMSLDDIIKRDRITTGRRGRGIGAKGGRGARSSVRGSIGGGNRKSGNIRKIGATARQMKAGGSSGGGGLRRNKPTNARVLPDKWAHDKFVAEIKSATLMISNLDYGVSDQDIRELFSEFGPLKKATVHYDSSGRSLGKAEVIFFKINDSIRAMKKYNGIPLDGRPMQIQPVVTTTAKTNIASRIGNPDIFKKNIANIGGGGGGGNKPRGIGRNGPVRNASGRRGRGGRIGQRAGIQRGQRTKVPTAAELDADLDAYSNKV